jgi:ribosomal protein S18 acetylase RimI-like enzyme
VGDSALASSKAGRPALYMIWDPHAPVEAPGVPSPFELVSVGHESGAAVRELLAREWLIGDAGWAELLDRILPAGMFVVRDQGSRVPVGTVSVIHNPRGSRLHFPRGGAIAYLYVMTAHRGKRLGSALMCSALARLRGAGYGTVWVAVEETRLPAIGIYLRVGFLPFLHLPDPEGLCARWLAVHQQLGWPAKPEQWPRASPDFWADRAALSNER